MELVGLVSQLLQLGAPVQCIGIQVWGAYAAKRGAEHTTSENSSPRDLSHLPILPASSLPCPCCRRTSPWEV